MLPRITKFYLSPSIRRAFDLTTYRAIHARTNTATCLPDVLNALLRCPCLLSFHTIHRVYHRGLIMLHLKIALKELCIFSLLIIFQYWGSRCSAVPGGIGDDHQDVKDASGSVAPKSMDAYITVGVVLCFSGLPDLGFHLTILYYTPETSGSCSVLSLQSWHTNVVDCGKVGRKNGAMECPDGGTHKTVHTMPLYWRKDRGHGQLGVTLTSLEVPDTERK